MLINSNSYINTEKGTFVFNELDKGCIGNIVVGSQQIAPIYNIEYDNGLINSFHPDLKIAVKRNSTIITCKISKLLRGDQIPFYTHFDFESIEDHIDQQYYLKGVIHALGREFDNKTVLSIPGQKNSILSKIKDIKNLDIEWNLDIFKLNLNQTSSYLSGFIDSIGIYVDRLIILPNLNYSVASNICKLLMYMKVNSKIERSNLTLPNLNIYFLYNLIITTKLNCIKIQENWSIEGEYQDLTVKNLHHLPNYTLLTNINLTCSTIIDGILVFP